MQPGEASPLLTAMRRPGVVLAGGRSTRFGSDKASAPLAGRPLLAWVVDALAAACDGVVVVRAAGQQLPPVEAPVTLASLEDRWPARGPLAGLATAFAVLEAPAAFVAACDSPLLQPSLVTLLVERLEAFDAAIPLVDGVQQPLVAAFRPAACLPAFEAALQRGEGSVAATLRQLRVIHVGEDELRTADPLLQSFHNANRPEALAELERLVAARTEGQTAG